METCCETSFKRFLEGYFQTHAKELTGEFSEIVCFIVMQKTYYPPPFNYWF